MDDNVNVTIRVPVDLKDRLNSLARAKRCHSDLTTDALQRRVGQDKEEI